MATGRDRKKPPRIAVAAGPSAAARAREAANLSLETAAKLARICPAYLRQVERRGAPYSLAKRLSSLYGCPMSLFLYAGLGNRVPK